MHIGRGMFIDNMLQINECLQHEEYAIYLKQRPIDNH